MCQDSRATGTLPAQKGPLPRLETINRPYSSPSQKMLGSPLWAMGHFVFLCVFFFFFIFEVWGCPIPNPQMALGQNQWYLFGVGAPPILVYFSGDWDVHWGYDLDFDPWLNESKWMPRAVRDLEWDKEPTSFFVADWVPEVRSFSHNTRRRGWLHCCKKNNLRPLSKAQEREMGLAHIFQQGRYI